MEFSTFCVTYFSINFLIVKYTRFGLAPLEQARMVGSCAPRSSIQRPLSSKMRWEHFSFQCVKELAKEFCVFCHPIR